MITQSEIKKLYDYDPKTGIFRFKFNRGRAKIGGVVGTLILSTGYLRTIVKGKSYNLHALVFLYMTGKFPPEAVDHINRIKTDNRFENLRLATKSDNCGNTPKRKNNTSGFKGVFKYKHGWMVRCAGKHIGVSKDIIQAAKLYDIAAIDHYGEFALTNKQMGLI